MEEVYEQQSKRPRFTSRTRVIETKFGLPVAVATWPSVESLEENLMPPFDAFSPKNS